MGEKELYARARYRRCSLLFAATRAKMWERMWAKNLMGLRKCKQNQHFRCKAMVPGDGI